MNEYLADWLRCCCNPHFIFAAHCRFVGRQTRERRVHFVKVAFANSIYRNILLCDCETKTLLISKIVSLLSCTFFTTLFLIFRVSTSWRKIVKIN